MRRAYNSEFLKDENGELIGINLGADSCAEHEWGINGIAKSFGIIEDKTTLGIERRMVNEFPDSNIIFTQCKINKKNYTVFIYDSYYRFSEYKEKIKEYLPSDLKPFGDEDLVCAWSERSFGILVSNKYKKELEILYKAFQDKDIAIGIGGGHVFKNGGLKFVIASKLPKNIINETYEADLDYYNLQKVAQETGIYELLDKAGKGNFKGWMALSPRWKNEEKKEVIFWLNPEQQQIHNFGWFTVEDLKEWAENKGKIMMNK